MIKNAINYVIEGIMTHIYSAVSGFCAFLAHWYFDSAIFTGLVVFGLFWLKKQVRFLKCL